MIICYIRFLDPNVRYSWIAYPDILTNKVRGFVFFLKAMFSDSDLLTSLRRGSAFLICQLHVSDFVDEPVSRIRSFP